MSRHSAIIPATRPDYSPAQQEAWLHRHGELVDLSRRGEYDVAFLGDSLTAGWLSHGHAAWAEHFAPLRSINLGVSGDRTQQLLWHLEHGMLANLAPKVAVVLIGTNNLDPGLGENSLTPRNSPPEIIAGVESVAGWLLRHLPATQVLLLGLLPRGYPESAMRQDIATVNAGLLLLAERSDRVHYASAGDVLLETDGTLHPTVMPDLLHPHAPGYHRLARAISPLLSRLLSEAALSTPAAFSADGNQGRDGRRS